MALGKEIRRIRDAVARRHFANEASVSQGVVLPLLHALGWPVFDPKVVAPEFTVEGKRVDFALCYPGERPAVFVEVKQLGGGNGADRQLFEYAFHLGVPMAVLTDGQEWHFYLPAEQGLYQERRVYRLDLVERDLEESEARLSRYLSYERIRSGEAFEAARKDYQSLRKRRQVTNSIPVAWNKLLEEPDDLLLELLSDEVESLSGFRPDPDEIGEFLQARVARGTPEGTERKRFKRSRPPVVSPVPDPDAAAAMSGVGFELDGHFHPARNARDVLVGVFREFDRKDPSFLEKFDALPRHGRKRRYLARSVERLYPDRPDIAESNVSEVRAGWYLGTNLSRNSIRKIIGMACEVAGVRLGDDLKVKLK